MHTHVIIKGSVLEDARQAILSRCIWMMWIYLKMVPNPVFHGSLSFGHSLVWWVLFTRIFCTCMFYPKIGWKAANCTKFFFCLILFKHQFCFSALSRSIQEPNTGIVWKGMNEVNLTVKTQYSIDGCAPELLVYLFDREWNLFSKGPNLYKRLCLRNPKTRKGSETRSEKRSGKEIEETWGKKGTEKRTKKEEGRRNRKHSDEHDLKPFLRASIHFSRIELRSILKTSRWRPSGTSASGTSLATCRSTSASASARCRCSRLAAAVRKPCRCCQRPWRCAMNTSPIIIQWYNDRRIKTIVVIMIILIKNDLTKYICIILYIYIYILINMNQCA